MTLNSAVCTLAALERSRPERDQILEGQTIGQYLPKPLPCIWCLNSLEGILNALARGLLAYVVFRVTGACSYTWTTCVHLAQTK